MYALWFCVLTDSPMSWQSSTGVAGMVWLLYIYSEREREREGGRMRKEESNSVGSKKRLFQLRPFVLIYNSVSSNANIFFQPPPRLPPTRKGSLPGNHCTLLNIYTIPITWPCVFILCKGHSPSPVLSDQQMNRQVCEWLLKIYILIIDVVDVV